MGTREFMERNFLHFNAATCLDAAQGWIKHLEAGNKMLVTLAGAMSTAELGISLAQMIREDKIHAICCTGANLEEDIFNLVAHDHYKRIPNYRSLQPEDEIALRENGLNRVTDTCIPEEEAVRRIEDHLLKVWQKAENSQQRFFPYEYLYQLLESGVLESSYQIDPQDSWMIAAWQKNLPIFTPGWEDSTTGNIFVSHVIRGDIKDIGIVKSGLEQMYKLVYWYKEITQNSSLGFFQIGGGIAGDFPICVVPLIRQDLEEDCQLWSYFAQISDSTTSYGSYSGAVPSEKITWGKLGVDTPSYIIESDATIVAPLIFNYVLNK
ncbi:deoxyhypusine synthase family protein [Aphanothece sacrum]|uniref:Deoxyhypusine synthase n=1 Tax=Aphanothece sacrum FPU1 TaxID=1920663 RepID=A0A401IKZ2_APHSA|nr:deoxyhypusine synthase family protein [Aphanothece sacrum]GBF81905.1 deoxyhypusine synthase [Aphanothece sacrum FPU1]GBF83535.1 deoxyhypusine synthase [Aphanothece sacrum FPU3]